MAADGGCHGRIWQEIRTLGSSPNASHHSHRGGLRMTLMIYMGSTMTRDEPTICTVSYHHSCKTAQHYSSESLFVGRIWYYKQPLKISHWVADVRTCVPKMPCTAWRSAHGSIVYEDFVSYHNYTSRGECALLMVFFKLPLDQQVDPSYVQHPLRIRLELSLTFCKALPMAPTSVLAQYYIFLCWSLAQVVGWLLNWGLYGALSAQVCEY